MVKRFKNKKTKKSKIKNKNKKTYKVKKKKIKTKKNNHPANIEQNIQEKNIKGNNNVEKNKDEDKIWENILVNSFNRINISDEDDNSEKDIDDNNNLIYEENNDKFRMFTEKTQKTDIINNQPLVKIKIDINEIIENSFSITYKGNIFKLNKRGIKGNDKEGKLIIHNAKYKCQYYRHNEIERSKLGLGAFCNAYIEKININDSSDNDQKYEYIK